MWLLYSPPLHYVLNKGQADKISQDCSVKEFNWASIKLDFRSQENSLKDSKTIHFSDNVFINSYTLHVITTSLFALHTIHFVAKATLVLSSFA